MTPLLTAEKALVGDPGHVILTGSTYGREKKQESRGGGGLMHYLQLKLEQGPLQGLTQRLVPIGLWNKDRHL